MIAIAKSQKLDLINSKVFNEALDYYSLHVYESLEAEILSLGYEIKFGEFLNGIRHSINESDKIPIEYFNKILNDLKIETKNHSSFVLFLLNIEFIYFIENNQRVNWSTLIDPDSKLSFILSDTQERKYFAFHPSVNILLSKHF